MYKSVDEFMDMIAAKNPAQPEFLQAVKEVAESLWDYLQDNPHYMHVNILER
jgi:glutamate dehydrogenase (NADP+)